MQEFSLIQQIIISAVPILLAITLHEAAHGYIAAKRGDKTALMLGRVTLNPLKHIDPMGTIVVPGILMLSGATPFGWAKPVPVTYHNLNSPLKDMAWVALAGPGSNVLMGLGWLFAVQASLWMASAGVANDYILPLQAMGIVGLQINIVLIVLNMVPVPPLDGSRVVRPFLPTTWLVQFDRFERYGMIAVLLAVVFAWQYWLHPPVQWVLRQALGLLQ